MKRQGAMVTMLEHFMNILLSVKASHVIVVLTPMTLRPFALPLLRAAIGARASKSCSMHGQVIEKARNGNGQAL
jgi:hypothetical protein